MKKTIDTLSKDLSDYEQIIKEQRRRIIDLRDENLSLKSRITKLEQERNNIAAAIIAAEQSKARILSEAKQHADKIIAAAESDRKKSELSVKYYCNSLRDLETRCERILDGISRELNKAEAANLRLIK